MGEIKKSKAQIAKVLKGERIKKAASRTMIIGEYKELDEALYQLV